MKRRFRKVPKYVKGSRDSRCAWRWFDDEPTSDTLPSTVKSVVDAMNYPVPCWVEEETHIGLDGYRVIWSHNGLYYPKSDGQNTIAVNDLEELNLDADISSIKDLTGLDCAWRLEQPGDRPNFLYLLVPYEDSTNHLGIHASTDLPTHEQQVTEYMEDRLQYFYSGFYDLDDSNIPQIIEVWKSMIADDPAYEYIDYWLSEDSAREAWDDGIISEDVYASIRENYPDCYVTEAIEQVLS